MQKLNKEQVEAIRKVLSEGDRASICRTAETLLEALLFSQEVLASHELAQQKMLVLLNETRKEFEELRKNMRKFASGKP